MTDRTFNGEQWAALGVLQERLHEALQQNETPVALIVTLHYYAEGESPTVDVDVPVDEKSDRGALDELVLSIWEEAAMPGYIVFGCTEEDVGEDLRVRTYVFCTPPCAASAAKVEN